MNIVNVIYTDKHIYLTNFTNININKHNIKQYLSQTLTSHPLTYTSKLTHTLTDELTYTHKRIHKQTHSYSPLHTHIYISYVRICACT